MGRKYKKTEVTDAVRAFWQRPLPDHLTNMPLTLKVSAAAVGVSRTALYKYDLAAEIKAAADRQQEHVGLSDDHYRSIASAMSCVN